MTKEKDDRKKERKKGYLSMLEKPVLNTHNAIVLNIYLLINYE